MCRGSTQNNLNNSACVAACVVLAEVKTGKGIGIGVGIGVGLVGAGAGGEGEGMRL